MKKFITSFTIAFAMIGISLFVGGCFKTYSAADFIEYVQDEDTISNFSYGFDIEVQDDTEIFLTGRVLSDGKMSLDYYGDLFYLTGDDFVYVQEGTKKSKIEKIKFEQDNNYEDVVRVMNNLQKYFSSLKETILDDASYYRTCHKKEENGCQVYTLDDFFYDGSFEYRQIYEIKYKDNQIVEYIDCVAGENTSIYNQTIIVTATSENITFPNVDEYVEFLDVTSLSNFVSASSIDSDMADFTFINDYGASRYEGEYHKTQDGDKLFYKNYYENELSYSLYVINGKAYVNHLNSYYDVKQYCFDIGTSDEYFKNFLNVLNDCKKFSSGYADEIKAGLTNTQFEIDSITKKEKETNIEICVKSHMGSTNQTLKYSYQANKLIKVEQTNAFSATSQQKFVTTSCNTSIDFPEEIETYKFVTSETELRNN